MAGGRKDSDGELGTRVMGCACRGGGDIDFGRAVGASP